MLDCQLGTSAIGKYRARDETFHRGNALGEINPVVSNGSNRGRHKVSVLDEAEGATPYRAPLPVSERQCHSTTVRLAAGRAHPCPPSAPGGQSNHLPDDQTVASTASQPGRNQD